MRVVARAACYFFVWPLVWHQAGAGGRRVYPGGSTPGRKNSSSHTATPTQQYGRSAGDPFYRPFFPGTWAAWPLELAKSRPWASGLSGPLTKVG